MAKIDRASGKGKVQTLAANNTNRLITEGVLRELLIDLWDSGALQIDEETFLNLQDLADRDYRVGECMVYDNGQGFKIFRATTAGGGLPFVAANWELLTSSGGTTNTLYSADGVISGTRKIQLPIQGTVFWNGFSENSSSVLELDATSVVVGGQTKALTSITGPMALNDIIPQNTSPDPVRILAYDPVNYVTKYINSNEIAGSNIYTSDGELTTTRSLTGNQGRGLFQEFFDTDIGTYTEYLSLYQDKNTFNLSILTGDGQGSPTSREAFLIENTGIRFFSNLGRGIKYQDPDSYSNVDWNDPAFANHIPSIQQVKDNVSGGVNIYTADGTLTGDREVLGDSKNYTLGTEVSPVKAKKSYSSGGSLNFNISDGSVDGDYTEYHNIGDGDFPKLSFYARRKSGATNPEGEDIVEFNAGAQEGGNYFGFYDYEKSNGGITFRGEIVKNSLAAGRAQLFINLGNKDFLFSNQDAQSDKRSEFSYDRNTGFSFDDSELGLGVRYAEASTYANVDWNDPAFANHIPSIQQVKDNVGGGLVDIVSGSSNVAIAETGTPGVKSIEVFQTTAGLLANVYFTGQEITTTEGNFYETLIGERGNVASQTQTVVLASNQTEAFAQDFLGEVQPEEGAVVSGVYAAFPIMQVSSNQNNQRFKIEAYICDGEGLPTGVGDGPVGTLGVNTILIADSGIIDLQANNPTNVNCQGDVENSIPILAGERFRYVVIAERVGSGSANKTVTFFAGSDYNSYFQIPNPSLSPAASKSIDRLEWYVEGAISSTTPVNEFVARRNSAFSTLRGRYFAGNTLSQVIGIKATTGNLAAGGAIGGSAFKVQIRYDDEGSPTQHVYGGGTLLTEQDVFVSPDVGIGTLNSVSNEISFEGIPLVPDKVYFVEISDAGSFVINDLSIEVLTETKTSPSTFLF